MRHKPMSYLDDDPFDVDLPLQDAVAVKLRQIILSGEPVIRYPSRRWDELPAERQDYWRSQVLEILSLIFAKANPLD